MCAPLFCIICCVLGCAYFILILVRLVLFTDHFRQRFRVDANCHFCREILRHLSSSENEVKIKNDNHDNHHHLDHWYICCNTWSCIWRPTENSRRTYNPVFTGMPKEMEWKAGQRIPFVLGDSAVFYTNLLDGVHVLSHMSSSLEKRFTGHVRIR